MICAGYFRVRFFALFWKYFFLHFLNELIFVANVRFDFKFSFCIWKRTLGEPGWPLGQNYTGLIKTKIKKDTTNLGQGMQRYIGNRYIGIGPIFPISVSVRYRFFSFWPISVSDRYFCLKPIYRYSVFLQKWPFLGHFLDIFHKISKFHLISGSKIQILLHILWFWTAKSS